jgi:hypothetical protein
MSSQQFLPLPVLRRAESENGIMQDNYQQHYPNTLSPPASTGSPGVSPRTTLMSKKLLTSLDWAQQQPQHQQFHSPRRKSSPRIMIPSSPMNSSRRHSVTFIQSHTELVPPSPHHGERANYWYELAALDYNTITLHVTTPEILQTLRTDNSINLQTHFDSLSKVLEVAHDISDNINVHINLDKGLYEISSLCRISRPNLWITGIRGSQLNFESLRILCPFINFSTCIVHCPALNIESGKVNFTNCHLRGTTILKSGGLYCIL